MTDILMNVILLGFGIYIPLWERLRINKLKRSGKSRLQLKILTDMLTRGAELKPHGFYGKLITT